MYKIFRNNILVAAVNAPTWTKKQENGAFALCNEEDAHGIVIDGVVYHIDGKPDIVDAETVIVMPVNETTYQKEQVAALAEHQLQTETALAELSILVANNMNR